MKNLRDWGKSLQGEKGSVRNGALLLLLGAALLIFIMKLDLVASWVQLLFTAIMPLLYGIVIAYVLNVFVQFFEKIAFRPLQHCKSALWKKASRPVAVLLAYVVVALLIVCISCFIIPGLIQSLSTIAETASKVLPIYVNQFTAWLNDFAQKNDLAAVENFVRNFNWGGLLSNVTRFTTDFLGSLVGVTVNVFSGVFSAVMAIIFSIYLLFGKDKLQMGVKSTMFAFLPVKAARRIYRTASLANKVFFSFIRGQLLECIILGTLCYIGMSLLGLDYALLISSVVAIGALIPILGAYIGACVGVVVLLLVNPWDSLIFLIFLLCLQQVEGNLIYPRVVGSSIGLPPVWTLFAVLFWGGVLGIPGILIGTPTTAVLYRLLRGSVRRKLWEKKVVIQRPGQSTTQAEAGAQEQMEVILPETGEENEANETASEAFEAEESAGKKTD